METIIEKNIEEEMKTSYLDYAMSVIVSRALPDVRDGLKPVQRRILFTMKEMGLSPRQPYRKSARVVGEVLGKYHPHGDVAVYEAMTRMVQDFSLRYPLVDGQGNFGSIDGDPPAAMRYTEVRLKEISGELLADIEKETVEFVPNYDNSLKEPSVLPAKLPNLLINGSSGIAVGMATNIPPHNLNEVVDGIIKVIDEPDVQIKDLMKIIKGPDFPTGGIIYGKEGIQSYFETGRGSFKIRSNATFEKIKKKPAIVIKDLPYQINKSQLLEHITELIKENKLQDIAEIRDESNREGIRIVIELKKETEAQIVLNQLYMFTQFEVNFGVIMLALVGGEPKTLNIKEFLNCYINHRKDVIYKRTRYELQKAEARAHILEGLKIALSNLDKVIKILKKSKNPEIAAAQLIQNFSLSKIQTAAILEMRLHQLTTLEREKIENEYLEIIKTIEKLKLILADPKRILNVIKEELLELKKKYGDKRRTIIEEKTVETKIEDIVKKQDVVVLISQAGYIRRTPVHLYKLERRGEKARTGATTKEKDFIQNVIFTNTLSYLLLFTNKGKVYWLRVYELPEGSKTSEGKAIVNLVELSSQDEKITAVLPIETFEDASFIFMATKNGIIKKTPIQEFINPRRKGITAINLENNDTLSDVKHTSGKEEIIIGTKKGFALKFKENTIRPLGRNSKGFIGIKLSSPDEEVVGIDVVDSNDMILTVTENGYGKMTKLKEYRLQSRGGKGIINISITEKNGNVVGIKKINHTDHLLIFTQSGKCLRLDSKEIPVTGRNAQGSKLIKLAPGDKVTAITPIK